MSRVLANTSNLPFNVYVSGPTYIYPPETTTPLQPVRLIPFNYLKNGVLELNPDFYFGVLQNANNYFPGDNNTTPVRLLGGHNMVTNIGPNLTAYITGIYSNKYNMAGGVESVSVYSPGVVTKVQILDYNALGALGTDVDTSTSDKQSGDSSRPPEAHYINGDNTNNYNTTYVFESPLTLVINFGNGSSRYYTFKTGINR